MSRRVRTLVLGLLTLAAPAWIPQAEAGQATVCDSRTGPADLSLTLKDMNGRDVTLSSYKGKVILLNLWATWCGPCKIEIPGFVELYKQYQPRGLVILGLSVDDTVAKLKPFIAKLKVNYPILLGEGRKDVDKAYPWQGLPVTFVIGRDGTLCHEHTGLATRDQIEEIVKGLLGTAPKTP